MSRRIHLGLVAMLALLLCATATAQTAAPATLLDDGYRNMYNLEFAQAHQVFQQWEKVHPEDPLGPVSDAAAYLFNEFDRLHVLELELFVDDSQFEHRAKVAADPQTKQSFEAALARAG